ncbi:MAG: hypothetical protein ACR2N7_01840 [Acidimicrobiia bacterium]
MYAPDNSANTWTDNSTLVCSRTFGYNTPAAAINNWLSVGGCESATAGIYVIAVSVGGNEASVSAFAIRASVGGSTSNVAVYGLGAMSLWMNEDNSNPTFKIVRVDPVYAGTELELGLFDPGDADGLSQMRFGGALSGYDCQVKVVRENGAESAWESDGYWNGLIGGAGGDWAGSSCGITTATAGTPRIYNGDWLALRFIRPPTTTVQKTAATAGHPSTTTPPIARSIERHGLPR